MRASKRTTSTGLAAAMLLLGACSGNPQVSTEVENEVAARLVRGVAMDSVVLDLAPWSAWDASGELVAQGTTDSVGGFEGLFSKSPEGGLLVEVRGRRDTLRALVGLDSVSVRSRVVTALVNVFTEAAVPFARNASFEGFPDSLPAVSARVGQKLLDSALGVRLPWREFASDSAFRGVAPSVASTPAPLAGFLRAISTRARRDGKSGSTWLDSLGRRPRSSLGADSLFAVELAGSMADLGLPQSQTTLFVQRLDSAAGHGTTWEKAWLGQQILPDRQILEARLPWAVVPANAAAWQRVVQVTGDQAYAYDRKLSPQARQMVRPGRSHEILAIAVGSMIAPDVGVDSIRAREALEAYLARTVPQAVLLLDQIRTEVWAFEPASSPGGGFSGTGEPDSGAQNMPQDKVAQLVSWGMQALFQPGWKYSDLQGQLDPAGWMAFRFRALGSNFEALDTMKAVWSRHPELALPYPFR